MAGRIVSLKPKYTPLVQRPCCCCVTCLQMILYRRGFGLFDQEELAKYFKIKIGKKDVGAFNAKLGTYSKLDNVGMHTTESKKTINRFFRDKRIPLDARSVRASEIPDLKNFLVSNLKQQKDIWMEYKTSKIHKERQKEKWFWPEWKGAHDNVIESIKLENGRTSVTLVDPFWYYRPRTEVDVEELKTEIIGFVVISRASKK